nr:XdhC family protein [Neptunicella marina]
MLNQWSPRKNECNWALGTIIATEGSCYRKPGAMMLLNDSGQYYGLLSGGCLEADILRQARKCWDSHQARIIEYDSSDEGDFAWQLGLGCGGKVTILLQPITAENHHLELITLHENMLSHNAVNYQIERHSHGYVNKVLERPDTSAKTVPVILSHRIQPPVHLAIFGGGLDALPLVNMATEFGWQITLCDSRMTDTRAVSFKNATRIVRLPLSDIADEPWFGSVDAAIVMNHHIELDANALNLLKNAPLHYLGLLGPGHRTQKVLATAGISEAQLPVLLSNPMGFALGGELPESIALATLAELHSVMFNGRDKPSQKDISGNEP